MTFPRSDAPKSEAAMTAADAVELVHLMERNGIEVYVDGGWAVDALLETQTRPHEDLDVAVPHKYVPQLRKLLGEKGYEEVPRDDTRDCNFVLGDNRGHLVDVHSYTIDAGGRNIQGIAYLPEHLKGCGSIDGHAVRCITPESLVKFHTGYSLEENDYKDVLALCQRFNLPLPVEHQEFARKRQTDPSANSG